MGEQKKIKVENVTLQDVKNSDYGCNNCLYYAIECNNASKFKPAISHDNKPTCKGYAYCD